MGFKIDPKYIENTYGVQVEAKEEIDTTKLPPSRKALKAMYEGGSI
jgi:hypothetical protein